MILISSWTKKIESINKFTEKVKPHIKLKSDISQEVKQSTSGLKEKHEEVENQMTKVLPSEVKEDIDFFIENKSSCSYL